MKKLLYFFLTCVVIGVIISTVFSVMPAFPMAGRAVLISVSHGKYQEAYVLFSKDFRNRYSLETFKDIMEEADLIHYKEVKWVKNVKDRGNESGYVIGIVTTTENKKFPVEFDFVHEKGTNWFDQGWRINTMRTHGAAEAGLM